MASAPLVTARGGARTVTPGGAARLELLEALLIAGGPAQCAQRALAWLQRRAGGRRGVCLAAHAGAGPPLVPVASVGVPASRVERFTVDLELRDHP